MLLPTLWRYLLSQYLKVLGLCTVAFIAILLTMRLDEIAHFATLGAELSHILLFTVYQIPYVLPIALPISCLISATLLFQRLSSTHELSALRASGMAFKDILAPILIASTGLAILNFYVVSEVSTDSHLATGMLKTELRSINPLLLLHNKHLMSVKGFYFDTLGHSQMGESASDIVLAMPNKSNGRLNLLIAKNLKSTPEHFTGTHVTLISSLRSEDNDHFDYLMLENIGEAAASIEDFSQAVEKKVSTVNNDHLNLPLLLARLHEEKQHLITVQRESLPGTEVKQINRDIQRIYSEIIRRISLGMSIFTFTLLGAAFGISIGRYHTNKGIFFVIGLAAFYLIAFFTAKNLEHVLIATSLLYLLPHAIIIILSIWALRRATYGIE